MTFGLQDKWQVLSVTKAEELQIRKWKKAKRLSPSKKLKKQSSKEEQSNSDNETEVPIDFDAKNPALEEDF